jgi:hypothetical protein
VVCLPAWSKTLARLQCEKLPLLIQKAASHYSLQSRLRVVAVCFASRLTARDSVRSPFSLASWLASVSARSVVKYKKRSRARQAQNA